MRSAYIAELILSFFTSRDRAAATVGDLMENAPAARFGFGRAYPGRRCRIFGRILRLSQPLWLALGSGTAADVVSLRGPVHLHGRLRCSSRLARRPGPCFFVGFEHLRASSAFASRATCALESS